MVHNESLVRISSCAPERKADIEKLAISTGSIPDAKLYLFPASLVFTHDKRVLVLPEDSLEVVEVV